MNVIAIFSRFSRTSQPQLLIKRIQLKCLSTSATDPPPVDDKKYDDDVKTKILAASMPFVIELGWSKDALVAGAEKVGYPGIAHGLFPHGGADLVQYFNTECNRKLAAQLKAAVVNDNVPRDFVKNAVESRLRMNIPYIPRWPQALAIMTLPPNVPHSLATLLTLVDDICYYAGDRSVDFSWYARRVALAGMYKATELYMLQDTSEDYKLTWEFLVRRLDELIQLHDVFNQSDVIGAQTKETISAAFVTARNIMGINWNR